MRRTKSPMNKEKHRNSEKEGRCFFRKEVSPTSEYVLPYLVMLGTTEYATIAKCFDMEEMKRQLDESQVE